MNKALYLRAATIYLPLMLASVAGVVGKREKRKGAAVLLATLWCMMTLLALQQINRRFDWWSFGTESINLRGIPLELYLGWTVLWGALPTLLFPRRNVWVVIGTFAVFDLAAMPWLTPLVILHASWWIGEAAALCIVLLPATLLATSTLEKKWLSFRAAMQVVLSGAVFLYLLPEIIFALRAGRGWSPLIEMQPVLRQLLLQVIGLLALPGVSAVMEFAERGDGTPLPYDPPGRLVTSGIYRYVANPMQLSCAMVMLGWALLLQNEWLAFSVAATVAYGAGLATWDENEDLSQRFGDSLWAYRKHVHHWLPRWRPYQAGKPATLYIAFTCGPCSKLLAWFERHPTIGLQILPAESLPYGSIKRIRYVSGDGSFMEEGVGAVARAFEHIHLGYALLGGVMRLPVLRQIIQMVLDASGFGPRIPGETGSCVLPEKR